MSFVIGQVPVIIIDLDENHNSGLALLAAMQEVDITAEYTTTFPSDLYMYTSAFVCLGIFSDNHVLTASEGQALADYLNGGGSLYMEGGDTWYYDNQTAVHPMFNIQGLSDGGSDLGTILGQSGTFTEGMSFGYAGDNSYIDHISPISPAVTIFANQSPDYNCAVAYDATTYKTIGSSFEFSGLVDGSSPSTKAELINEILNFLEVPIIPVELVSFTANLNEGNVKLSWVTATELNNAGFEVQCKTVGQISNLSNEWENKGFVEGNGTTTETTTYSFNDKIEKPGTYLYRLKQIDYDGTASYSPEIEVDVAGPTKFALYQNYPNPFNPGTTIKFALPEKADLIIAVYNSLGERVAEAFKGELDQGYHEVNFDASNLSSGVYFYRFESKQFVNVKKMLLLK
jgi:hypothetical protein